MAKSKPFAAETQKHPLVVAMNLAMIDGGGSEDVFWESDDDRFISMGSIEKGADIVEFTMTRDQFYRLLDRHL